jgi:hypothetical protein
MEYRKMIDRDPFVQVSQTAKSEIGAAPIANIDNITLVGSIAGSNGYTAICEDNTGFGYILSVGDSIVNGYIIEIDDTSVTFKINEYGYIREVNKSFEKE